MTATTEIDWDVLNTVFRFNAGYILRGIRFRFSIVLLANSPDVPYLRQLLDTHAFFKMEVKQGSTGYGDENFGLINEIFDECMLNGEEVLFEVEGGAPVITFNGLALRKNVLNRNGEEVYRVGNGSVSYGDGVQPFQW